MNHYMKIDKHNPNKGHHITITDNGDIFYNQAIHSEHLSDRKQTVPGHDGWYDFYPEDEPVSLDEWHGYQEYINEAYRNWEMFHRPLDTGDTFGHWFNQAEREVEILAVTDNEALGIYTMPAGRSFLAVFYRSVRNTGNRLHRWKRNQSLKTLPKKWGLTREDIQLEIDCRG